MKKRALISVYDKEGLLELAEFFSRREVEMISTGGTYRYLKENGFLVTPIEEVTHFPEILDGRVKTLHPAVHAGILARRENAAHMDTLKEQNILPIDYVIVNLYPFFEKVKEDLSFAEKVEFIDIGGPTMLRAAAKNFQDVTVICDKRDYQEVIEEINSCGEVKMATKKKLAGKVFSLMSAYDAAVANFLLAGEYPPYLCLSYEKEQDLRYGENPHQSAAVYTAATFSGAMNTFKVLNGKALSYNNFKDVDIAWKCVNEFEKPACCALKHNTPCGVAMGENVLEAYEKAYAADSTSIFGGIVAFNQKVDYETAAQMKKIFLEVIAAPAYDEDALKLLKEKKNLRLLQFTQKPAAKRSLVSVDGAILLQDEDLKLAESYEVVTKRQPSEEEMQNLIFGMKVVKYVKSNAIVTVSDFVTRGIGGGQVNRIWPAQDALKRGKGATVLASDAFFPFRDVVDAAAKYGIKAIIQPGGSLRDQESIDACNEHDIAMVFTKMRHFKH